MFSCWRKMKEKFAGVQSITVIISDDGNKEWIMGEDMRHSLEYLQLATCRAIKGR